MVLELVVVRNVFNLLADSSSVSAHRVNMSLLLKFNKIKPLLRNRGYIGFPIIAESCEVVSSHSPVKASV